MAVAVLDIGKTSVKISIVSTAGEQLSLAEMENRPVQGDFYLVPNIPLIWDFLIARLADAARSTMIEDVIVATHGSSGFLVNRDGTTTALPDYESEIPREIEDLYAADADGFAERGSGISAGAGHLAKQLFWLEQSCPRLIDQAETLLLGPQYWAWRLCGVPALELTSLTAQSHLWNVPAGRFAPIVSRHGWTRLMPSVRRSGEVLGAVLPELARLTGLDPRTRIRCGVHDSTAGFHRFEVAGFENFTLLSTGTWMVTLSDLPLAPVAVGQDVTTHVSAAERRMSSVRAMAGREFDLISGQYRGAVAVDDVRRVLAMGSLAVPSFVTRDGIVPGSAGKGCFIGPEVSGDAARAALALSYYAMLADLSLDVFVDAGPIIIDGNVTAQPLLGAMLAALRPDRPVLFSGSKRGTIEGAALLAGLRPAADPALIRQMPDAIDPDELRSYRRLWRSHALPPHRKVA